jgi:chorismate mutase
VDEWRRRIDEIDEQIVRLLGERARYALKIGREKREQGLSMRVLDRELEVLARIVQKNSGPLPDGALMRIYRVILDETLALDEGYDSSSEAR